MMKQRKLTYLLSWEEVQAIEKQLKFSPEPVDPLKAALVNFIEQELENLLNSKQISEEKFEEAKQKADEYADALYSQVLEYEGPLVDSMQPMYDKIAEFLYRDLTK